MPHTGGCQCGRIRFIAHPPLGRASVCYCRMCQRASGQPFMAFASFQVERVEWSRAPDEFVSSNHAIRGFCGQCGTPLTWREQGGERVSITLGSFDDPAALKPAMAFNAGQAAEWLHRLFELPDEAYDLDGANGFLNNQKGA